MGGKTSTAEANGIPGPGPALRKGPGMGGKTVETGLGPAAGG